MKTPEEVVELFRKKHVYLQTVYPSVGVFDECYIYQNPDGGWQYNYRQYNYNYANCAAITIRAGDDEAHEVHGGICARWRQEGGAFDETCKLGWIGAPISDEEAFLDLGDSNDRISHFERGDIIWIAKNNETRIVNSRKQEFMEACQKLHEKVIGIIADLLDVDEHQISQDTTLEGDLNADEFDLMEINAAFEAEFGVEIPNNSDAISNSSLCMPVSDADDFSDADDYCWDIGDSVGEIEQYLLSHSHLLPQNRRMVIG